LYCYEWPKYYYITFTQGPSLFKNFGMDKPYFLRFDDVTMFTQLQYDLFVKLTKLGAHYGIDTWLAMPIVVVQQLVYISAQWTMVLYLAFSAEFNMKAH